MAHPIRHTIVLLVGLLFIPIVGFSQSSEQPAWLRTVRADMLVERREYGKAIQLYREALALDPDNPEALFGLGRTFKSVNDYPVAEGFLRDAITHSDELHVPQVVYDMHYELADLLEVQRRFSDLQDVLGTLIEMAEAVPPPPRTLRPQPEDLGASLERDGLDRTLLLYRMIEDGATRARGDLGALLVGLGRYLPAGRQSLVAVIQRMSTVIDALLARDPDYEYSTVLDALRRAAEYPETRAYLSGSLLYRDFFYLATALYSLDKEPLAREIWSILTETTSGEFATRARVQLLDPGIEPLLVPPE